MLVVDAKMCLSNVDCPESCDLAEGYCRAASAPEQWECILEVGGLSWRRSDEKMYGSCEKIRKEFPGGYLDIIDKCCTPPVEVRCNKNHEKKLESKFKCNGYKECEGGDDEDGCDGDKRTSIEYLAVVGLACVSTSFGVTGHGFFVALVNGLTGPRDDGLYVSLVKFLGAFLMWVGSLSLGVALEMIRFHVRDPNDDVVNPPGYEIWEKDPENEILPKNKTKLRLLHWLPVGGYLLSITGFLLTLFSYYTPTPLVFLSSWSRALQYVGAFTSVAGSVALLIVYLIFFQHAALTDGKLFFQNVHIVIKFPFLFLSNLYSNSPLLFAYFKKMFGSGNEETGEVSSTKPVDDDEDVEEENGEEETSDNGISSSARWKKDKITLELEEILRIVTQILNEANKAMNDEKLYKEYKNILKPSHIKTGALFKFIGAMANNAYSLSLLLDTYQILTASEDQEDDHTEESPPTAASTAETSPTSTDEQSTTDGWDEKFQSSF